MPSAHSWAIGKYYVMALVTYILGDCPGCGGKGTYGNIDVRSTYISRGCRVCRYKEQVPLPPVQKKVLYLDQFFLSHAFRGSEKRFLRAAKRIEELTALQLLVVPYSTIHEEETHLWEHYADLMEFIKATSHGHKFSPAYEVEESQLERAIDVWLADKPATYALEYEDAFRDDVQVWESYFRIHVGQYMGDRERVRTLKKQGVQDLINLFDDWRGSKTSFEEDFAAEHEAAAREYWQSYGKYVQRVAQGDYDALIDSPIMSQVVRRLLHHIPEEILEDQRHKKVAEFLLSKHFRMAPYQDLSSRIFATLKAMVRGGAYKNTRKAKSRLSGFFHDVQHVATYAPYCDAIIVDQPMAELVTKSTVATTDRYGVQVFSLRNWEEMFSWFDKLEESITPEHQRALEEAYPVN